MALVTPFAADGVNEGVLRELVRFHLREGTDALVVNGSTGEAAVMSPAEQRRAVEVVVDEAAKQIPVIAGCGGSDTAAVCELARQARAAGADALLVAPPPYNKPPQRGIVAHFRRVMEAGDLPTIVYNVPGRTACNLLPETVEQLAAEDPRVAGVKEASGDISQVAELCRRVADRVAVYSGNDDQVVPVMALGGVGVISVLANVAPRDTSRMAHAFLERDVAESRALQLRYLPLIAALFRESNPIPVKAAVGMLGFAVGSPRLPLVDAPDAVLRELRAALQGVGVATQEAA
ncbi:MAG TPA: 4-hydroxy-tetrahydrodipicolinate synthase [Longimicrobiaceae bacterium]|nr:4-hydroxy-tetrahydrodipicolinate synthase [Longimicrobiaceae bacterium]